jgi:putative N-acetyltransferase (TIGR04045 family)
VSAVTSSQSFAPPEAAPTASPATGDDSGASVVCRVAVGPEELEEHFAVRRRVFCDEQRLFDRDDRDERDGAPRTLHVVGLLDGRVEGAVRLYPLDEPGVWKGDRLAVLPERRVHRMGAMLVSFAVRTAGELGGRRMIAQIQLANVRFFESLGWRPEGEPGPYHGLRHQRMTIAVPAVSRSRRAR